MNLNLAISLLLHNLAAIIWIGGMFFAHFVLRPTLKKSLEPPARIQVALGVFRRFFPWVWVSIASLWVSGIWIVIAAMGHRVGLHVHIMMGTALVMTLVFAYLYAFPYQGMRKAVDYENWRWASAKFSTIRKLMAINLMIGLITVTVAVSGPLVIPGIAGLLHPTTKTQTSGKAPAAAPGPQTR